MIEFRRIKIFGEWHTVQQKIQDNAVEFGNITLGVHEDAHDYPDGTKTAFVASENEFGHGNVPARYWLRGSIRAEDKFMGGKFQAIARLFKGNKDMVLIAIRELGRRVVAKIKEHIYVNDIGMKANAESTIIAKGGDTPMIDTQHLVRQIDYKVAKLKDIE